MQHKNNNKNTVTIARTIDIFNAFTIIINTFIYEALYILSDTR